MVNVWGVFQLLVVNVTELGVTTPSDESSDVAEMATSDLGCWPRTTVKVAVVPSSAVKSPVVGVTRTRACEEGLSSVPGFGFGFGLGSGSGLGFGSGVGLGSFVSLVPGQTISRTTKSSSTSSSELSAVNRMVTMSLSRPLSSWHVTKTVSGSSELGLYVFCEEPSSKDALARPESSDSTVTVNGAVASSSAVTMNSRASPL